MSNKTELLNTVNNAINQFPDNTVCRKIDQAEISLEDYHKVLRMIFHQVREGPSSFALAGVNCSSKFHEVKDYLFHHADEEKTHWQWILNDLANTGYQGENVKSSFPLSASQNYIAFNYFTALKMPVARLAIAAVLEGIGAEFGAEYARKLCALLKLKPEQAQFYFGHGDTDKEHIVDIWRVIDACELTEEEWREMCYAAKTAGTLYKRMYEEALN